MATALYDRIGVGYDTTRQADPYLLSRLIHYLRPRADGLYLNVGSGTGSYTIAMHQAGVPIRGLEISPTMLARAKEKAPAIAWHNGARRGDPVCVEQLRRRDLHLRASSHGGSRRCFQRSSSRAQASLAIRDSQRHRRADATLLAERIFSARDMEKASAPYQRFVTIDVLESAGFRSRTKKNTMLLPTSRIFFSAAGSINLSATSTHASAAASRVSPTLPTRTKSHADCSAWPTTSNPAASRK